MSYRKNVEYRLQRRRTASLPNGSVEFSSYFRVGTFQLHSDAVQALKRAGLYTSEEDWDLVMIDGVPHEHKTAV